MRAIVSQNAEFKQWPLFCFSSVTLMLVQTWWLSAVCVDNPTVSPGFRPEWKSISLLRTVNAKIQQEWMITIVLFVRSGPSCDCNLSFIYPPQFFLELPLLSACWRFIVVGVQTLSNHFIISGKSHSCCEAHVDKTCHDKHSFTLFVLHVSFSWKPYTVNHRAAVLFHASTAQNITFASIIILESFAVIWLFL